MRSHYTPLSVNEGDGRTPSGRSGFRGRGVGRGAREPWRGAGRSRDRQRSGTDARVRHCGGQRRDACTRDHRRTGRRSVVCMTRCFVTGRVRDHAVGTRRVAFQVMHGAHAARSRIAWPVVHTRLRHSRQRELQDEEGTAGGGQASKGRHVRGRGDARRWMHRAHESRCNTSPPGGATRRRHPAAPPSRAPTPRHPAPARTPSAIAPHPIAEDPRRCTSATSAVQKQ